MNKKTNAAIRTLTIIFLIFTILSLIYSNKVSSDLSMFLIAITIVLLGIKEENKTHRKIFIAVGVLILFESIYKIIV